MTDQYPLKPETAIKLAALQFRAKFGDEVDFDKDFLGSRIVEYLPQKLVQHKSAGKPKCSKVVPLRRSA